MYEDKFKHGPGLYVTQTSAWFYSSEIWEHRYEENGTKLGLGGGTWGNSFGGRARKAETD